MRVHRYRARLAFFLSAAGLNGPLQAVDIRAVLGCKSRERVRALAAKGRRLTAEGWGKAER